MLTLNFLIHSSPLCSGTLRFGSQSITSCSLFFHLSGKVLAFSKVSSTYPILWWPYTFSVFLLLSQGLEKFLLEDQIVNILGVWTLQSLSKLHIESCKHSLKTCKWMGMTLLQQNFVHRNRQSENEPEFLNPSSKQLLRSGIPYLDCSSRSVCTPFWTVGYPRAQRPSSLACSECSVESGCYSKAPSAENTAWDECAISILTVTNFVVLWGRRHFFHTNPSVATKTTIEKTSWPV